MATTMRGANRKDLACLRQLLKDALTSASITAAEPEGRRPDHPPASALRSRRSHRGERGALLAVSLVGREAELAQLQALLEEAAAGRPRSVLVEGAAGVGKTALLGELRQRLPAASVLAAVGDEAETRLHFGVLDQLLGSASSGHGPPSDRAGAPRDPFIVGAALLHVLGDLSGPALLVVDDTHLADTASLQALAFALRRLGADTVLAAFAARTEDVDRLTPSLLRHLTDQGTRICLGGLSGRQVRDLALALGHPRLSLRASERLREHTGGNPLHLRALLDELPAEVIQSMDRPLPAPRSFAAAVVSSVRAAPADVQRLVRAAAVLGQRSWLDQAGNVGGVDDPSAALDEAVEAALLEASREPRGWRVSFRHPLVRSAIHDDLGPGAQRDLHLRAAEVVGEPGSLLHRVAAASGPDPELAAALVARSRTRSQDGALEEAAALSLQASRLNPAGPDADRLLLNGVEMLLLAGALADALALVPQLSTMAESTHRLHVEALIAWFTGRHDQAEVLARRVWDCADEADADRRAGAATILAQMRILRNDGAVAAEWADRALTAGRLPPVERSLMRAIRVTGLALAGRPEEAAAILAGLPPDPADIEGGDQDLLLARGLLRVWTDDWPGALRDLSSSTPSPERGLQPSRLAALGSLVDCEYRLGDWDAAEAHADQLLTLVEDTEQWWLAALAHAGSVLVAAGRGHWDRAHREVDAAIEAAETLGDQASWAYASNAQVHLAWCQNDYPAVVAASQGLLEDGPGGSQEPGFFGWPPHRATALVHLGRLHEAAQEMDDFEELARQRGRRSRLAALARVRGELAAAAHDRPAAREAFDRALKLGEGAADALEHGVVRAAYGGFLRRCGERAAGRGLLHQAQEIFSRLGARPFLKRCESELSACGLATQPPLPDRDRPLTPREQAVTRLVCAGLTNCEIARELFVSVKTVEYHLGHVYAKVGVGTRTQLVVLLAAVTDTGSERAEVRPGEPPRPPERTSPGRCVAVRTAIRAASATCDRPSWGFDRERVERSSCGEPPRTAIN